MVQCTNNAGYLFDTQLNFIRIPSTQHYFFQIAQPKFEKRQGEKEQ